MRLHKEVIRKIDDIERLAYELAAAIRKVRHQDEISAESISEMMARNIFPPPFGTVTSNRIECGYTDASKFAPNMIGVDRISKVPLDAGTYPLKFDCSTRENEPDVIVKDEYLKEGREVLELRFPDNDSGWDHWNRLLAGVRKNEKKFSVIIEEVEPGKMKAVLHLA